MASLQDVKRSPTFLVNSAKAQEVMSQFKKERDHITEEYTKNKPLCFSARAYQLTHPAKIRMGYKDADATLCSPMLLGVCDGVSQLEEFDMDPSELPIELLKKCEDFAMMQLVPDDKVHPSDKYQGPIHLLKSAYEDTESFGSTTVLLAALDNSTKIHGKLHPMIAVLSIGDCELLMLRRPKREEDLQAVFHTEMQRIDQNVQTPLQLARVDERIDAEFEEKIALEVIEKGSAVHCVSAYEGDILILGSDGVFDNLFLDEIVLICNEHLRPQRQQQGQSGAFQQTPRDKLYEVAQIIVREAHSKSSPDGSGHYPDTPIGHGGKVDDTSVVVGEVIEWTQHHAQWVQSRRRNRQWQNACGCGVPTPCNTCGESDGEEEKEKSSKTRGLRKQAEEEDSEESEDDSRCTIA